MSNSVLLSQNHSALVNQMQSLAQANDFLYSTAPSTPVMSKTILKLSPENKVNTTANSQELTYKLPKRGMVSRMYLKVTLTQDGDVEENKTSNMYGSEIVERVDLVARGRVLRTALSDARQAQSCRGKAYSELSFPGRYGTEGVDSGFTSNYDIATQWGRSAGRSLGAGDVSFIVPIMSNHIGWELDNFLGNAYDGLFCEQLHLRVRLANTSSSSVTGSVLKTGAGVIEHKSCDLIMEVLNETDEAYRKYRNTNFPTESNLKRLVQTAEQEPTQEINFTNGVSDVFPLYTGGVCNKTIIRIQTTNADHLGINNKIDGFVLRSGGRVVYEQRPSTVGAYRKANMIDRVADRAEPTSNNSLPFIICWDELCEKMSNNTSGAVNYSELPNLTLELTTWHKGINGAHNVHICHIKSQFEQIDSNSGMVAVSERA